MMKLHLLFAMMCVAAIATPERLPGQTRGATAAVPENDAGRALDEVETPGTRRALILCGLPGDDEHRKPFAE